MSCDYVMYVAFLQSVSLVWFGLVWNWEWACYFTCRWSGSGVLVVLVLGLCCMVSVGPYCSLNRGRGLCICKYMY